MIAFVKDCLAFLSLSAFCISALMWMEIVSSLR